MYCARIRLPVSVAYERDAKITVVEGCESRNDNGNDKNRATGNRSANGNASETGPDQQTIDILAQEEQQQITVKKARIQ